ncbi:putative formin, FH2 domain-containing protein [Helianthus annuus]|nr:putative formin, FH2 domain-containing protein [Helianthus annuus]KAJ0834254.1 putative formin, FH2 domain-containing protein [Helianthus annuus]
MGPAVGFMLDSLLEFGDIRASNSEMTLMHYLCKVLASKSPEVLDFHVDLVSLESASKIQLKYLANEMQAISKGLERVEEELVASANDGPVSEVFHNVSKHLTQLVQKKKEKKILFVAFFRLYMLSKFYFYFFFCFNLQISKVFMDSAELEVRHIINLYSQVGRNADALSLYFGEDPSRYPFEQVTQTLFNFVRLFRKAHEENFKQAEQ